MRNMIAIAGAAAMLSAAGAAYAAEHTVTLAVRNMTCVTCGPIVRAALSRVPGVQRVEVSQSAGTATVAFDDAVAKASTLVAATTNAGYPSSLLGAPK